VGRKRKMINFKGINEGKRMSKTQNSLRFKLRYPSHLCLLSVNPPSALSLWSSGAHSNPSEDYSLPFASLTRTYVSLCLHFPVDLFKDNHIKNPCGGMLYIFIASCSVNSARFTHTLISDGCSADSLCQMTYIACLRKYNTATTSICADMRP